MEATITKLMSMLDEKEDMLLLGMLSNKLADVYNTKYQEHLDKHSVTDKQKHNAMNGIKQTLRYIYKELDYKSERIDSLIDRVHNCNECPFSISTTVKTSVSGIITYNKADDTDRCKRCSDKTSQLNDIVNNIERNNEKNLDYLVIHPNMEEVIRCKAIINKLRTKLRDYATN